MSSMLTKRRLTVGILAALALSTVLAGCVTPATGDGHGDDGGHDDSEKPHEPAPSPVYDTSLGAPDVVLEVSAGTPEDEFAFSPSTLRAPAGSIVEIRVTNRGEAPHSFAIHAFDVDTGVVEPGETVSIKLKTGEAGEFEAMCDVAGHYAAGMKGTLVVEA